jgi:hypothetical protein
LLVVALVLAGLVLVGLVLAGLVLAGWCWSGWPDSNRRPPRPKRGALAKLRYSPYMSRV